MKETTTGESCKYDLKNCSRPTTPQPQQKEYIITEDELCKLIHGIDDALECHYFIKNIRSRPAPLPIDTKKCFEDLVYSSAPWKIYRQDAGMGEHDYAVFLNDVFFCRTDDSQTAMKIVNVLKAQHEAQR